MYPPLVIYEQYKHQCYRKVSCYKKINKVYNESTRSGELIPGEGLAGDTIKSSGR